MEILYVANGGFGDASWTTSWPRLFTERGHVVDVFLMQYIGNPFHANPFIRNMFIKHRMEAAKFVKSIIADHHYDIILIPDNTMGGMPEVIDTTKGMPNVLFFKGCDGRSQFIPVFDFEIPPLTKPEWFFTKSELEYAERLKGKILFHPLCSGVNEKSRNIDFDLVIECSKKLENVLVVYGGGTKYVPINELKRMESAGVSLLWEDYNCFNDESGSTLGKFLALTSQCQGSVHAWSGSFTMSMGYNKPYVMVVPGYGIRANHASPYIDTKNLYERGMKRADCFGCLKPSAWCITDQSQTIVEAVGHVLMGKTCSFDKSWTFIK
jgi:hypothetical protein